MTPRRDEGELFRMQELTPQTNLLERPGWRIAISVSRCSKSDLMSAPRVLLLGGHGKISLHLTPLLLAKSWNVTSVIRDPKQGDEILRLGEGQKGQVDVLIESLDDVKNIEDAQKVLDHVEPAYVVWSAGTRHAIESRHFPALIIIQAPEERADYSGHTPLIKRQLNTIYPLP